MHTSETPEFAVREAPLGDRGVVVEVRGELDMATAPMLRECLNAVVERKPELVVVDLSCVDFLDSVALAVLLAARKALTGASRMAVVVAPDSYARLIFDVTGVDQWLHLVRNRDEALSQAA